MKKMFETKEHALTELCNLLRGKGVESVNLMLPEVCHTDNNEETLDVTQISYESVLGQLEVSFEGKSAMIFTLESVTNVFVEVRKVLFEMEHGDFVRKHKELCQSLMEEIYKMAHGVTFKFDETRAPRMYFDGAWRSLIKVSVPTTSRFSTAVSWHDERCLGKGANASTGLGNCPVETQVKIYDLICQELLK